MLGDGVAVAGDCADEVEGVASLCPPGRAGGGVGVVGLVAAGGGVVVVVVVGLFVLGGGVVVVVVEVSVVDPGVVVVVVDVLVVDPGVSTVVAAASVWGVVIAPAAPTPIAEPEPAASIKPVTSATTCRRIHTPVEPLPRLAASGA